MTTDDAPRPATDDPIDTTIDVWEVITVEGPRCFARWVDAIACAHAEIAGEPGAEITLRYRTMKKEDFDALTEY